MLTKEVEKRILQFVHKQPCSIQEIARLIGKNWRTAESYVLKISEGTGAIIVRTFRAGSRNALKVVYWNNADTINSTEFQERLLKRIENAKISQDFSPFDIYNYVAENKRGARCGTYNLSNELFDQDLVSFLRSAKNDLFVFAGNCTFVNLKEKETAIFSIIQELAERGIKIKVLGKVDFSSLANLQKLLSINYGLGKELIEVRHCEQPLRGFLVDETSLRLKEKLNTSSCAEGEMPPDLQVVLYDIRDQDWVRWAKELFLALFRTSISGQKRLEDLRGIRKETKLGQHF